MERRLFYKAFIALLQVLRKSFVALHQLLAICRNFRLSLERHGSIFSKNLT